ncbi:putative pterin-4-alpha-carbinolamine dehydratase [Nocardia neocaledoniensis NBRC 108232]|uniref:Putative pterin-4-alpha-carbinolamine dehydratase n=1 Tax=Nocardia neocaledoniensis TaxID=236511 RepID=A0A317NW95_9NOCA|nr:MULTISPECIES: 4a-hydroxytetrahydrobiopterin dehydratase [Nocardia]PWV79521.1 pterin-4-alpha-carbinolamine dehydratase [Nocardia neocaledoniensis]UGT57580.1 4a-hydroxytetrahydrobiopterin dehydratase [Nocardia asteroides]GEM30100.1 putative pterin-4-alpha-carbinolamine dehydratase [Nocardia neocaledoniensis NBRC 108232]
MGTPKPALLSDPEITIALATLPEWSREGDAITRTVKAPTFLDGIEIVRKVATAAEAADHHPDIDIRWRTVRFTLSTHSAGGLTANDTTLAHTIDEIIG